MEVDVGREHTVPSEPVPASDLTRYFGLTNGVLFTL